MPFFLLWGFLVWLGASLIFRVLGQVFFIPDNTLLMVSSYILVIPLILVLTFPIYKFKKIQKNSERMKAAVCIALPGMLIDAIVLIYFDQVFVNLSVDTDRFFASWLMWAYSLILLTGFFNTKKLEG
ncbi:DUF5367 domain-containing protein [Lysinibacillus sp. CNPSo 3705]|uniref:DUF5367 domain-containing protein n=1 Tax=Lysinibacillus sp. CNPSo 3705 TaxID=3028148 RepID=UPI001050A89E|nr:DUF5367 domain-containing protein [Lysinibacillus sp. CNPSo 3705]MDD1502618.1 DUF5367 domain-containing protein [Lysinibacillus sp. CNPSo 3705]